MIASVQVISNEIFGFVAVLVSELLSRKGLVINGKANKNC